MKKQNARFGGKYGQRSATMGWRAGIAKDRLVFIIICLAAIAVAGVVLVISLGPRRPKAMALDWQCLACNDEFSTGAKTSDVVLSIDCPKCGGKAVRMQYRKCPECDKQVVMYRMRLTEEREAEFKALVDKKKEQDALRAKQREQGIFMPEKPGQFHMYALVMPVEFQYWVKQANGNYGWSPWIGTEDPQNLQIRGDVQCPHCGAKLF
jgi:DNA-directed RNA polymerase subunit RPC12/RpoP